MAEKKENYIPDLCSLLRQLANKLEESPQKTQVDEGSSITHNIFIKGNIPIEVKNKDFNNTNNDVKGSKYSFLNIIKWIFLSLTIIYICVCLTKTAFF